MSTRRWLAMLALAVAPAIAFAASQGEAAAAKAEGPVTLTAFWTLDAKTGMTMKSYAEMTVFKEIEKRTASASTSSIRPRDRKRSSST